MKLFDSIRLALNSSPFEPHYKVNRMRPPGAVEESLFVKLCVRCSRCVDVCPYKSLKRSGDIAHGEIGTPYIYAEENACKLCVKCTSVCPTGALLPDTDERDKVKIGIARIDEDTCHNHKYYNMLEHDQKAEMPILCNYCFNVCPLRFDALYLKDGIAPIVTDKCTGCGICVERCPNAPKSIYIIPSGMPDTETAGYYNYLKRTSKK